MLGPSPEAIDAYYRSLEPFWHPALAAADLGTRPSFAVVAGRPLVLVRLADQICCFDDVCRHLGSSLSLGEVVDGDKLRCAYHGWAYDKSGRCVDIPARRGVPIPAGARVEAYGVKEKYGLIWVCLSKKPAADVPAFPEFDDPSFRATRVDTYEPWAASAPRLIMGALDDTHFPWVHPGVLGDPSHPEAPEHDARVEDGYVVSTHSRVVPDRHHPGDFVTLTREAYCTPTSLRLVIHRPGETDVIFEGVCPVAHDSSIVFIVTARDYDKDPIHDEHHIKHEFDVQSQDRPIAEKQKPWLLPPLSSRLLLYVRPADLPLVVFQKWLEQLGVPQI